MSQYYVYRLRCPKTHLIRYIGESLNPFNRLRYRHYKLHSLPGARLSAKELWLLDLLKDEICPILEIITPPITLCEAMSIERRLVVAFRAKYPGQLLNQQAKIPKRTKRIGGVDRRRRENRIKQPTA